jgi:hypothetical protein
VVHPGIAQVYDYCEAGTAESPYPARWLRRSGRPRRQCICTRSCRSGPTS